VVAVNLLSVLICCWLREVAVRERSLSLSVCCVTRVTHSALRVQSRPEGLGRRYTNSLFYFVCVVLFTVRGNDGLIIGLSVAGGILVLLILVCL
jgi:hypothetical protein